VKASPFGGAPALAGRFVRFLVFCLAAGLAGCAAQPGTVAGAGKGREAIVMERSQARWDAVLNNRLAEAYQLYSPASREVMSYEDFVRAMRAGFWKAAKVERVECLAEETCEAIVSLEYAYRGSQVRTPVRETWIHMDGNWWYVQKG
jgi:hypothetical protein